jgi:hypothetical protein
VASSTWRVVEPRPATGPDDLTLTVATDDEDVLRGVEEAAFRAGILLERVPEEDE